MEFLESIPVTFKEISPNHKLPEKWKEVMLNTGGTHSTLEDIKLPSKAGGYWFQNSLKANTRNRLIFWQTTPDAIEFSEASLDVNLSSANLRCKVAPGTPPLNGMTVWERPAAREVIILAATVSSVHRLVFPHPETLDRKATFGSLSGTTPSIFFDTTAINNPNNYFILNQYSSASTGVAHTSSSLLRDNGEAVFALAFGYGGDGGILLVKLPVTGSAVTYQLKKESTVPRFLSGITGALRGKSEGIETYGVVVVGGFTVAVCGDACLRAWSLEDAAPRAVSQPLSQAQVRPKPPPHGHMLQKTTSPDGSVILVVYLSFPNECEFVVIKMHDVGAGAIKFSTICRIYGPQLDLLDYSIGYGDGSHVIWALWSQPDGETLITSTSVGAEASWRAVAGAGVPPPLPALSSHQQYRDALTAAGLFPTTVISKALRIYRRTWGGSETGNESDVAEAALNAVQSRMRHLLARNNTADQSLLMHKCWSDLYSWCLQYMEGLQKPLGLMASNNLVEGDVGWWCGVVRRAGLSLVAELEPLERLMLSPDADVKQAGVQSSLSAEALQLVCVGARWERLVTPTAAAALERRILSVKRPIHTTLRPLLADDTILSPEQVDSLTAMLEPIKDLQNAVLELNDALRLDVPEIDASKEEEEGCSDYDNLFCSDLGVAVVTEAIRQMADMRARIVRAVLMSICGAGAGAGGGAAGGRVPGAGHCAVHWQAYRALLTLMNNAQPSSNSEELFRLKLSSIGLEPLELSSNESIVYLYCLGAGGRRARARLRQAGAPKEWHQALPLMVYHMAHQLWAVSGGFEFGRWLAAINRPKFVVNYVNMLEPWCEWNACSRQFILGLSLLELEDAEGAYSAFCKAAKGVATEPFLRQLVESAGAPVTQHQALVLYYMKVIKLFEIHDAGACVVRLAETAISIADKDDPNLPMFQWVVFKWHLSGGRTRRALAAAAAADARARASAAAAALTTLAARKELGALVTCGALAAEAEAAAVSRAKLHDAHTDNPYYDFLYALYVHRQHYRKAAAIQYERASRCLAEGGTAASSARRRHLAAAATALRLAAPEHAYIATRDHSHAKVIGPEELAAEFRQEDPDAMDPVRQALLTNEVLDFNSLYQDLTEANLDTLLDVTKRVISTGQAFPHWFIQRFMEVDCNSCIRALLSGGRAVEAGRVCIEAFRRTLSQLVATTRPATATPAPLAAADVLLAELEQHTNDNQCREIYDDLQKLITEFSNLVVRTSEDMKMARIQFPVSS